MTEADRANAASALAQRVPGDGPLVIVAPGAAYGPSKLWPAERFAQVIKALPEAHHAQFWARRRSDGGQGTEGSRQIVRNEPGLDLGTLKAVYEKASLVLTNDTGPRHIAVALGVPVVCIMGPNDPRYSALPGVEKAKSCGSPWTARPTPGPAS